MNNALEWAKSNVFIIIFVVVMIAALVTMPLLASGMNEKVREEVRKRAGRLNEFSQIENTDIQWPGSAESRKGVVNREFIERYRSTIDAAKEDADRVFQVAIERNRADHEVLMPELFPAPPRGMREILPERFHQRLLGAYDELIRELGSGSPPDPESVRDEVALRREQVIGQILARDAGDDLSPEEEEHLRRQLAELRMLLYQDAADGLKFYMSRDVLQIPAWDQSNIPNLSELFERQWRFWIHRDVLRGLARANGDQTSLLRAPVKRVVRFDFIGAPVAGTGGEGGRGTGGGGMRAGGGGAMAGGGGAMAGGGGALAGGGGALAGGGGAMAGGGGGGAAVGGPDPEEPPGPVTINTSAEVAMDFTSTFTGRRSNQLYDVRYVELELILDTARVPEVLDALAQQNFMTIVGLQLGEVDPFADASEGYFYGPDPVSRLTLQVETIWFRSWTAQHMPAATRTALGITSGPTNPGM